MLGCGSDAKAGDRRQRRWVGQRQGSLLWRFAFLTYQELKIKHCQLLFHVHLLCNVHLSSMYLKNCPPLPLLPVSHKWAVFSAPFTQAETPLSWTYSISWSFLPQKISSLHFKFCLSSVFPFLPLFFQLLPPELFATYIVLLSIWIFLNLDRQPSATAHSWPMVIMYLRQYC